MVKKRKMLATDMDGTIIPLEVNSRTETDIAAFKKTLETSPDLTLAYVTGRHRVLV